MYPLHRDYSFSLPTEAGELELTGDFLLQSSNRDPIFMSARIGDFHLSEEAFIAMTGADEFDRQMSLVADRWSEQRDELEDGWLADLRYENAA